MRLAYCSVRQPFVAQSTGFGRVGLPCVVSRYIFYSIGVTNPLCSQNAFLRSRDNSVPVAVAVRLVPYRLSFWTSSNRFDLRELFDYLDNYQMGRSFQALRSMCRWADLKLSTFVSLDSLGTRTGPVSVIRPAKFGTIATAMSWHCHQVFSFASTGLVWVVPKSRARR